MTVDFMIIGAQKAATTSLQHSLRSLSGVYMPPGESAFFEEPDYSDGLWRQFPGDVGEGVVVGIKRPDLLCRDTLIERVSGAVPEGRFIVVLREPIARAVSAFYHLVRHAHLPVTDLDSGLLRGMTEHSGMAGDTVGNSLVRYGLYGRYLSRWFEHYPADRFLVLSQKFVSTDPAGALRRCCAHIGVPMSGAYGNEGRSENVGMYDERYLRLYRVGHLLKTRPIGSEGRRSPSRNPVFRVLGSGLTKAAVAMADERRRPQQLSADTRLRLEEIYRSDLEVLRPLVEADAIDWSYDRG